MSNFELFHIDLTVIEVDGARNAFRRHVRFGQRHRISTRAVGITDFGTESFTGTEDIVLRERTRQNHTVTRGETGAQAHTARRTFFHHHFKVHLIARARNRFRVHRHSFKEAQTVNTVTRELHSFAVVPGSFILTHFTANYFVLRLAVTGNIDVAYICATARVDCVDNLRFVVFHHNRRRTSGCKRIAQARELIDNGGRTRVHNGSVIDGVGFDLNQLLQFILKAEHVARQFHTGDVILLPFSHVDRDENVLLIRSN